MEKEELLKRRDALLDSMLMVLPESAKISDKVMEQLKSDDITLDELIELEKSFYGIAEPLMSLKTVEFFFDSVGDYMSKHNPIQKMIDEEKKKMAEDKGKLKPEDFITWGKDLGFRIAHHSRKKPKKFNPELAFTPILNRDSGVRKTIMKAPTELRSEVSKELLGIDIFSRFGSLSYVNKPEPGTGMWVSKITPDNSTTWYDADLIKTRRTFYEVIPNDDCRVLLVDNDDALILVDQFMYDFEELSKHFDLIFVNSHAYFSLFDLDRDMDLNREDMFYGWDCVSGVFLNPAFTFGEKFKAPKREEYTGE